MSLRFIIGRSRSGKTSFCLNEIKEKQNKDGRYIYIVPEQYSLQAERELVGETGGIISAVVLSFRRLADNIFSEMGGINGKNLSDTGKLLVLRNILLKNEDKLKYFSSVAKRQGFVQNLGQEIKNMTSGGISPEDLIEYKKNFDENSPIALKIDDMAFLYSEYCKFISDNYVNSDGILSVAAQKMGEAKYIKDAEVWLDGFYGFTYQEYEIIKKLLSACKRVSVVLTIDPKDAIKNNLTMENSFYEPWDTMSRLKKLCAENGFKIEDNVVFSDNFHNTEGMKSLEKEYLTWNRPGLENSSGIKLMEADTATEEINMCAAEIIRLVRDEGLRFKDIALTTRSLSDYVDQVKLTFNHYGIPFFMDMKREISGHPCVELAGAIAGMAEEDLSYESVFRCLKTEMTDLSRYDRDILENYVIRYGIKGQTWIDERWQWGFENDENAEAEDRINDIKDNAIAPFRDFYKKYRKGKHLLKDITLDLYTILEKLNIPEKLEKREEEAQSEGDMDKAQEQMRCFEMLGQLFEEMVMLLGEETVTIGEYRELLQSGVGGLRMGIIPAGMDSVVVGDIERTRLPQIKALFVVGVNEGVLPSVGGTAGGIFTERENEQLEKAGADLAHFGVRLSFEEQYLIYLGITKPSDKLYICRSKFDMTNRATKPSSVIARLEEIFTDIKKEYFDELSIKAVDRPIPVLHRLGKGLLEDNDIWKEAYEWLNNNDEYKMRARLIKYAAENGNDESNLSKGNIDRLYGKKMYSSVSRLETFASCPFYYYARYSLGANERKVFKIETPDIGSLFHSALEEIDKEMKEHKLTWKTIDEEQLYKMAEDAVDKIAPNTSNRILLSTAAYKYMLRRIKRVTKRAVSVLKEHMHHGKFETLGSEIGFGMGELPPISIKMPGGKELLLRGKIDRVDVYRKDGVGYVKIIDYKSGKKEFSLSDIYYGLQLQLLLYMDAFLKTGGALMEEIPKVGGVFYFRIMDPVIKVSDLKGSEPADYLYKQFCMTGLACDEADVLEALDEVFENEETKKSDIVNVDLKKTGTAGGNAVSMEKYQKIMTFVNNKAAELGQEIADGKVNISPILNGGKMPCDYCEYRSVCRFEGGFGSNTRKLTKMSASEVWNTVLSDKNDDIMD